MPGKPWTSPCLLPQNQGPLLTFQPSSVPQPPASCVTASCSALCDQSCHQLFPACEEQVESISGVLGCQTTTPRRRACQQDRAAGLELVPVPKEQAPFCRGWALSVCTATHCQPQTLLNFVRLVHKSCPEEVSWSSIFRYVRAFLSITVIVQWKWYFF